MKRINFIYILLFLLSFNKMEAQLGSIVLYENDNSGGAITLHNNWNMKECDVIWDNKISSIYIPNGFKIQIFQDIDFKGKSIVLNSTISFKDTLKLWDDKISSIKILKKPTGYTLFFSTYFLHSGKWNRMDDIVLSSEGIMYYGTRIIMNPTVNKNIVSWKKENKNLFDAKLNMSAKNISGWIIHPFFGKVKLKSKLFELVHNTNPPFVSKREKTINIPVKKIHPNPAPQKTVIKEFYIPINGKSYSSNVKIYTSENFTGESKLISKDWYPKDYEQKIKWDGKINSIRVPEGWSIRVYYFDNFRGSYLELSDNWTLKDNPEWKGKISSIKIVSKQNSISSNSNNFNFGNVKIYKTENFTGESKLISKDWHPKDYEQKIKWDGKISSIRVPEGWSIRVYYFNNFSGSYLELSDDWTLKDNPDWKGKISSIKIIQKP